MKAFAPLLTFIGILWDLNTRQVSLPDNKRLKFLSRVNSFIAQFSRGRCSLRDVEKLHGSLCYISFVYPDPTFLRSQTFQQNLKTTSTSASIHHLHSLPISNGGPQDYLYQASSVNFHLVVHLSTWVSL